MNIPFSQTKEFSKLGPNIQETIKVLESSRSIEPVPVQDILREFPANFPLSTKNGKAAATLNGTISQYIIRNEKLGIPSPISKVGRDSFVLSHNAPPYNLNGHTGGLFVGLAKALEAQGTKMSLEELAQAAIRLSLFVTPQKNPQLTIKQQLSQIGKRDLANGKLPTFIEVSPGVYDLTYRTSATLKDQFTSKPPTLYNALEKVLEEQGSETPMSAEIACAIIKTKGYYKIRGNHPAASLKGTIRQANDKYRAEKKAPTIVIYKGPLYGLKSWKSPNLPPVDNGNKRRGPFIEGAFEILEKAGEPLPIKKVVDGALAANLISTATPKPEDIMNRQLHQYIERQRKQGLDPVFQFLKDGNVGLTLWKQYGLKQDIEDHNRKVKKDFQKKLYAKNPKEFEEYIAKFLTAQGYRDVKVVGRNSGDGGIDIEATFENGMLQEPFIIQVKRWEKNVRADTVREMQGILTPSSPYGMIITLSGFSEGATKEANAPERSHVHLIDGEKLVDLLVEIEMDLRVNDGLVEEIV